jgi:diacylglycerol O-acyltransferase / wax synthase
MGTTMTGAGVMRRLSSFDQMFLRLETPEWPCHFGGLTVMEGRALLDDEGRLRMSEITGRLERRLPLVPQLRRRLHVPGPLGGRPLWVDDPAFVPVPGGDREVLETAARVSMRRLDRRRPLWELWFFTGLREGRVAAMLKLHHSVADGMAAVTIMGSLFDLESDVSDPAPVRWVPEPVPSERALRAENLAAKTDAVRRLLADAARPGSGSRMLASAGRALRIARSYAGANPKLHAPSTSLNRVVGAGRRLGVVRLDLAAVKDAAHAHDATVNDVVLDLWSGGLRRLLASRNEATDLELITSIPVSLRADAEPRTVDNRSGWVALALPTPDADPSRRLDEIARRTRRVKATQPPAAIASFMAALAATPLARAYTTHQRTGNVLVTNVPGPPVPMYMLGARVEQILPIVELVGNVGLVLCAFSYAGQLGLVVTADAGGFPDLDVLLDGMTQDWAALSERRVGSVA